MNAGPLGAHLPTPAPHRVKLLSNGRYHLAIDRLGNGACRWNGLALTRWKEDAATPPGGTYLYLRDDASGAVWSPTTGPLHADGGEPARATFDGPTARFECRRHGVETTCTVAVDAQADVDCRRVTIANRSAHRVALTATSCAEVVLAPAATDAAQPAFSKLFIETSVDSETGAVLATRRPSKPDDPIVWLFHLALRDGRRPVDASVETDRNRFVGRGRDVADPAALDRPARLSGTVGPVLDAVVAVRVPVVVEPGVTVTVEWHTGVASTRDEAVAMARRVTADAGAGAVTADASAWRDALLDRLGAADGDAVRFDALAGALFVANAGVRGSAEAMAANRRSQPSLWGFGISGDSPIVVVHVDGPRGTDTLRAMVRAHAWWKAHGVASEMLVLAEGADADADAADRLDRIRRVVTEVAGADVLDHRDGIVVRDGATLDDGDRVLFEACARIVARAGDGIDALVARLDVATTSSAPRPALETAAPEAHPGFSDPASLADWNGHGGFTADRTEYVVQTSVDDQTPAPWVNILANPGFGTIVSESGSGSTWHDNAHEFRLTPWSNDPVSDPATEAIWLRDEGSGRVWSPTLLPARAPGLFEARHGFGSSTFLHRQDGIESTLTVFVDAEAPVKVSSLLLRNASSRARRIAVTGYVEWVLGDERAKTAMHVVTERVDGAPAVLARNAYNTDFGGSAAFLAVDVDGGPASIDGASVCGDRAEVLGANGSLAHPVALDGGALSGRVGAGLDPCAAVRVVVEIAPGADACVVIRLGAGASVDDARRRARECCSASAVESALDAVRSAWRRRLGVVQVRTPDPNVDALANGWLLYQVLASRFWGRTGFYQSSGAFGFRDQLQDAMALVHAEPGEVRAHLLRCAARQFVEGDVQHWWHEPSGKGIRTRCSDDYLWLPFVTARYVEATGDDAVLHEQRPFLRSRALKDGEASNYEQPEVAADAASLHEHCRRAIEHGLRFGPHGLPLMDGGDWNDGMNLVGAKGRGESVWLAFFLVAVLRRYAPVARANGDAAFADRCEHEASGLVERIEASAWDGDWYRRAWFDDGTPLGSADRRECRIDAIAQSWSVISGAAPPRRATAAMASMHRHLVHHDPRVVQLLDPPFDTSEPSPGYIEGYVPGVRENGGQYTHAAVWSALGFAMLGDADRAWELVSLIEPISHGADAAAIAGYRVEPYAVAGDVYAFPPHAGRGGWTWYTGSAGWMYQLLVESLLGFQRRGDVLRMTPLLPRDWPGFELAYMAGATRYSIACRRARGGEPAGVSVDGVASEDGSIRLRDDGLPRAVVVTVAAALSH